MSVLDQIVNNPQIISDRDQHDIKRLHEAQGSNLLVKLNDQFKNTDL